LIGKELDKADVSGLYLKLKRETMSLLVKQLLWEADARFLLKADARFWGFDEKELGIERGA
jgi:hypothetical protein